MVLSPEHKWKISFENGLLVSKDWNGDVEEVSLGGIKRVYVRTTDDGPHTADVWYGLEVENGCIEIPQGCTGEETLIEYFNSLPGFKMNGMNSTENKVHECWVKQ